MATNWDVLIKNHIPGRDWGKIKNVWVAASRSFDPNELLDLSDAVEPILAPNFDTRDSVSVFEFPGGSVAAFNDAAAILMKCAYLLRFVGNCVLAGQPTWASVDAYHFSFLAGRSLLALLGLHFVRVADAHGVLDVFPAGESAREIEKFRKAYPRTNDPARLIFRIRSEVLSQRVMWALLLRAINVTNFDASLRRDIRSILDAGEGFSRSRNDVLYRNVSWLYEEDLHEPSTSVTINDDIHSYAVDSDFFSSHRDANFAFAAVFVRILWSLLSDIRNAGGNDVIAQSSYGHCLSKFVGFEVQRLDALFAGIYRKDSYGIAV